MKREVSSICPMDEPRPAVADWISFIVCWIASTCRRMFSVAEAVLWASALTSVATTPKRRPYGPPWEAVIDALFKEVREQDGYALAVDLPSQTITKPNGATIAFEVDAFSKERLLNGWDQIGLTLRHEARISAYEAARASG